MPGPPPPNHAHTHATYLAPSPTCGSPSPEAAPPTAPGRRSDNAGGTAGPGTVLATRVTPTGHLYVKPVSFTASSSRKEMAVGGAGGKKAAPAPTPAPVGGRKMLVYGSDDRVEVDTSYYPYSAVGYLLTRDDGKGHDCSGALIYGNVVLLAG